MYYNTHTHTQNKKIKKIFFSDDLCMLMINDFVAVVAVGNKSAARGLNVSDTLHPGM